MLQGQGKSVSAATISYLTGNRAVFRMAYMPRDVCSVTSPTLWTLLNSSASINSEVQVRRSAPQNRGPRKLFATLIANDIAA